MAVSAVCLTVLGQSVLELGYKPRRSKPTFERMAQKLVAATEEANAPKEEAAPKVEPTPVEPESPAESIATNAVEAIVEGELPAEKVATNIVESVSEAEMLLENIVTVTNFVESPVVVEKVVTNVVEKVVERVVEKPVEKIVEKPVEKIVEKPVEKVVTNVVTKVVERVIEMPVEKVVERIVERPVEKIVTNVVEKVVVDPSLEAKNTDLAEDNEQLRSELESEREKLERMKRAMPSAAKQLTGRPAKITSDSTVYNRKEGIASFEGHVHVDDEQYQMHADRVFLFMEGTNELKRIVAIGNVAMTNEMRRAYGAKATYSKKNGLVVLYSGDGVTAEVRDESKVQDQVVRGRRIRFWVGTEQVEVDDADLTGASPGGGASSLKKVLGK